MADMPSIVAEDDKTFTLSNGNIIAKDPTVMAPGGAYSALPNNTQSGMETGVAPGEPVAGGTSTTAGTEAGDATGAAPEEPVPTTPANSGTGIATGTGSSPESVPTSPFYPSGLSDSSDTEAAGNPPARVPFLNAGNSPGTVGLLGQKQDVTQGFLSPEARSIIGAGMGKLEGAGNRMSDAEQQIGKEEAVAAGKAQEIHQDTQLEQIAYSKKVDDLHRSYQDNFDRLYNEIKDTKIKPMSIFEDGNLGQNILAGFSILIGNIGSDKNAAMQVFDKAIDRDLKVQELNLENKKYALNTLGVRYKAALEAGMDSHNAKMMAKGEALKEIGDYLTMKTAPLKGTIAGEKVNMQIGEAYLKAGQLIAEATKSTVKTESTYAEKPSKANDVKVPDVVGEKATALHSLHNEIIDVRKQMDDLEAAGKSGVFTGWMNAALNRMGLADKTQATKFASLKEMLVNKASTLGRSNIKVLDMLGDSLPNGKENYDEMTGKLDTLEKDTARNYYGYKQHYGSATNYPFVPLRQTPMEREAYSETFGSRPSAFK